MMETTKLPPKALLDLYRGLGMQEFFNLIGWPGKFEQSKNFKVGGIYGVYVDIPKETFRLHQDAVRFLKSIEIEVWPGYRSWFNYPSRTTAETKTVLIKPW